MTSASRTGPARTRAAGATTTGTFKTNVSRYGHHLRGRGGAVRHRHAGPVCGSASPSAPSTERRRASSSKCRGPRRATTRTTTATALSMTATSARRGRGLRAREMRRPLQHRRVRLPVSELVCGYGRFLHRSGLPRGDLCARSCLSQWRRVSASCDGIVCPLGQVCRLDRCIDPVRRCCLSRQ